MSKEDKARKEREKFIAYSRTRLIGEGDPEKRLAMSEMIKALEERS